jgi:hypothetical protein
MDARGTVRRGTGAALALAAWALLAAACGRGGAWPAAAPPAPPPAPDPGYRAPPEMTGLTHGADGAVALQGRAMPSAQVRLASPAGARVETTADGSGAWSAALGPVSEPTLYGLSAEAGGRRVQAEGYVAVMPGLPTVALLRAGAGARALDAGRTGLRILAIDMDGAGVAVVSGRAGANAPLRIMVDGAMAMEGRAEAGGRFSLTLPKALPPGPHRIQVMTMTGVTQADLQASAPRTPPEGPYLATPQGVNWRIDWITPGGGPQTTLLLADADPEARP